MIKVLKKPNTEIKVPENLVPTVFRCSECGCTIRRLEDTDSYILMSVNPAIDKGLTKICPFCYKLREYRGVAS
jgi:hypothetical protein